MQFKNQLLNPTFRGIAYCMDFIFFIEHLSVINKFFDDFPTPMFVIPEIKCSATSFCMELSHNCNNKEEKIIYSGKLR